MILKYFLFLCLPFDFTLFFCLFVFLNMQKALSVFFFLFYKSHMIQFDVMLNS